jgi:hypothetical protein
VATQTASRVLIRWASTAAGWVQIGHPPAGSCWIVKSLYVTAITSAASSVTLRASGGGVSVDLVAQSLAIGATAAWQGWLMLMETDSLWANPGSSGIQVWLSGAQLPSPPAGATQLPF